MLSNLEVQIEQDIQRIKALLPQGEELKSYLGQAIDEKIASVNPEIPMGVVPPSMLSTTQMFASARMAVEVLEDPGKLLAKPEGLVDLGVIEWILRPALLLKDGLFEALTSGPWQQLDTTLVQSVSSSVCRIDLCMYGYDPIHLGTGFVVGKDADQRIIIMTNAHVLDGAIRYGWPSLEDLKLACDFTRYSSNTNGKLISFASDYQIHSSYDLALVYLEQENFQDLEAIPAPLKISATVPDPVQGLQIGVIGHPSFNSNRDSFPKCFGFGDEFGVKRFSPGYIRGTEDLNWRKRKVNVFLHDASTLSGSSGSCILDLASMNVTGLHFGGWPKQKQVVEAGSQEVMAELFHANGAVPLWTLKDDPLLSEVHFY